MTSYIIIIHYDLLIFTIVQSWPRLPGKYANTFDPPVTPEVTFDPELPIMAMTFDLNNRKFPPRKKTPLPTLELILNNSKLNAPRYE